MPNRLAESNSPYLLQHKDNPVDWYPWGDEALQRAVQQQKPIFLSVGYAACHWCHVMEHESFEDPEIADSLNQQFVCIKVDREERPDVDQIYMHAVQALTGQGGWPMSVFLTPEGKPFYGGTYYPPKSQQGMPGFDQILSAVADSWTNKREQILEQAQQITQHLRDSMQTQGEASSKPSRQWITDACEKKAATFDAQNGGFGDRPKFPHPMDLDLFLRQWNDTTQDRWLNMVTVTLSKMADGGIYDHLGGGFARYSVDEKWLVPHFEKMLYDNALLAGSYLRTYQATGNQRLADVARHTLEYLMRDMIDSDGGIQSTEDADSEGVEGKYYVWTYAEVMQTLGDVRGKRFCDAYNISPEGNFEGKNILNLPRPLEIVAQRQDLQFSTLSQELQQDRQQLLDVRATRARPGRDDKVLVSWNALAIDAFALGSQVLQDNRMLDTAISAGEFIWSKMLRDQRRLLHCYRQGSANFDAYLDDYATTINAFLSLFEASGDDTWVDRACVLADVMLEQFSDQEQGGFYFTAADHEELIIRTKDYHDSSVPSGNGEAAYGLHRLGEITKQSRYTEAAAATLQSAGEVMTQQSMAASRLLAALHAVLEPTGLWILQGGTESEHATAREHYFRRYRPTDILVLKKDVENSSSQLREILAGKNPPGNQITLFFCKGSTCQEPITGMDAILERMK